MEITIKIDGHMVSVEVSHEVGVFWEDGKRDNRKLYRERQRYWDARGYDEYDDLISAGMRREIAGRINRIVALEPLTVSDYKSILTGPVKSDIEYDIGWCTYIDDAAATVLAKKAAATGLGVRWMKSAMQNAIDDAMFDVPEAMIYGVVLQDGEICCQAWMPREIPERVVHELHIEEDIELVADSYAPTSTHSSEAN